ncbi:hypothetical protein SAMN05216455_101184 [Segatella bryantii]|nr:hypothetical protein SAMN05216455_101184 [Segatella bryantii]
MAVGYDMLCLVLSAVLLHQLLLLLFRVWDKHALSILSTKRLEAIFKFRGGAGR